jgi:prolyl-tRNA editing enzyme YbaK/EbsC (Cys-tRNA(Pro) deacylase)
MKIGTLNFTPAINSPELLAVNVSRAIESGKLEDALAARIDPTLADTAAFCEHYNIGPEISANCVIVEAKRGERTWYAACMILATQKADINGVIRHHLDARKVSFAPMDIATSLTGMEYGGITPIGLPSDWPVLVDKTIGSTSYVVIGSGLRGSKIVIPGSSLALLPGAEVIGLAKAAI